MKAIMNYFAGAGAIAAIAASAPAAAQYYPGDPYGYGYGYGPPGQYSPYGYGVDRRAMINQCVNAVQARLGGYGTYGYGPYGGGGRVLGISRVEPRAEGGLNVRGVATSGYAAYGYAPNSPNLVWRCRTDFRGFVVDVDIDRAQPNYDYGYTPWNYDYSPYGYQRY
jgi:hypothetical protein